MEFITKYSESALKGTKQVFTRPSMTEPDNAMSIPEIIARFTRGLPLNVQAHPWTSGTSFPGETPESFFNEPGQQPEPGKQPEPVPAPAPEKPAPSKPAPEVHPGGPGESAYVISPKV